jgi:hypothetical protein
MALSPLTAPAYLVNCSGLNQSRIFSLCGHEDRGIYLSYLQPSEDTVVLKGEHFVKLPSRIPVSGEVNPRQVVGLVLAALPKELETIDDAEDLAIFLARSKMEKAIFVDDLYD